MRLNLTYGTSIVAVAASAVAALAIPTPTFGQVVADRTLSDVEVDSVGGCKTLTVNFNIRVQMLSYFPTEGGRELHVRVRPLDADGISHLRESLRTPNSVPELRSIEYEGDNPSGPVLSLFFTHDMRFEIEPGKQPQSLVIRLDEPGPGPICSAAGPLAPPAAVLPAIDIPAGLYTVNLVSKPSALGDLTAEQKQALAGKVVYDTSFERDAQQWHRLRVGFFKTREDAEQARAAYQALWPEAWVVKVSADEREQGVAGRVDTGMAPALPAVPKPTATPEQAAETARLVGEAEQAIRDDNPDRAIQLLTNALALPENTGTPRALELLGLTRERKGQTAHAQAEYEEYLRRYPKGEASDRVRQRLATLTGGGVPTQLRAASGGRAATASQWTWGLRGSFSQFYFRDQSTTKFIDAAKPEDDPDIDNSVNLNQLLSTGDITITGGNDRRQVQLRAAGSYTGNFRAGGSDIKALTALYLDYSDNDANLSTRIGRQTRNSSGVLGRFDGVLLGWQAKPNVRVNAVGGFPVLTSRQMHVLNERPFYGVSVDVGKRRSPFQATLYWFDQRSKGGFVDRQSVGFEGRYLASRFNAFTIIDYDVKFKKLNLGLVTLNYNFPDNSNLSLTADYRQSPLLTANNALIGQIDSSTLFPITDLRDLRAFFTDSEIYKLAEDRTLVTKSVTASYSRPISTKLQANFDFTVTDTGGTPGTPASSGTEAVMALPATGTEYYYGAQLVGTGLLMDNDIYIVSGRYADTQRTHTYTIDVNARVPVTKNFRASPRLRYGHRTNKLDSGTFDQFQPTLRLNYYPMRNSEVELEVGANFTRETNAFGDKLRESGYVLSAGYRIDF